MARTFIAYPDTIYGHMLGAIVGRYIKTTKPNEEIIYWPNLIDEKHRESAEMCVPQNVLKRDSVYIVGQSPSATAMLKLLTVLEPKFTAWYDFTEESKLYMEDSNVLKGIDVEHIPGFRSTKPDLGVRLWSEFFPQETVPPCVRWLDSYYQGCADVNAKAFVQGLRLLETCPKRLELKPDNFTINVPDSPTPEEEEVNETVWDACFNVSNPVDFGSESFNPETEMHRMTWDATFQIMNMGNIVDTLIRLNTQYMIEHDSFKQLHLPDETVVLLANARECDPDVIRDMFTRGGATAKYAGWYYLECTNKPHFYVSIVRLPLGTSCIDLAKKFEWATGTDDFATFRCDTLEYRDSRIFWRKHLMDAEDKIPTPATDGRVFDYSKRCYIPVETSNETEQGE